MRLTHAEPPKNGRDLVDETLNGILDQEHLVHELLGDPAPSRLEVTEPHPLYGITLQEVAAGRLLTAARLTGWRYLVAAAGEVVAAVDLTDTGEELSYVWHGPVVDATVDAIHLVEEAEEDDGEFELRALELRGIQFLALWLSGPRQLLVPVLNGSPEVVVVQTAVAPEQLLEESDVAPALAQAARRTLELPADSID